MSGLKIDLPWKAAALCAAGYSYTKVEGQPGEYRAFVFPEAAEQASMAWESGDLVVNARLFEHHYKSLRDYMNNR